MARPQKNDIDAGIQNWDGKIDDNDEALFNAPIPIHEHTGDETDLEATFPAASYDRCIVWINHTIHGHWLLMFSNGTAWEALPKDFQYNNLTATTSQTVAHDFVRFTGTGTVDYDFLAAASWQGRIVKVRNDKTSGTLNLDPNGAENINGVSGGPLALAVGSTATIFSDGTELYAEIAL